MPGSIADSLRRLNRRSFLWRGAQAAAVAFAAGSVTNPLAAPAAVQNAAGTSSAAVGAGEVIIPALRLHDQIRGGLLGQILGDLNGLQHEMKYIQEPGNVTTYVPSLPDGAWTDDDTDVEWVYVVEMQRSRTILLPMERIAELWKEHINKRIWCSHLYVRQLLNLGIQPPLTGSPHLNPWANFNLSGQFVCESWGLISPGMPQTATRIGTHYTHVAVDGEPIQSTQFFDTLIATAFLTTDLDQMLDAGLAAVDPTSTMFSAVGDARKWHRQFPDNWRATRRLLKEKYAVFGGDDMRDRNGVIMNGSSVVAALLYGKGDFTESIRYAFNFGWDADNVAAMAGTIMGVAHGARWIERQGWNIKDLYRDTCRDNMPTDETITRYGDRLIALADQVIQENGGTKVAVDGAPAYRIRTQQPAFLERLPDTHKQFEDLVAKLKPEIEAGLAAGASTQDQARAAYLALCLDLASAQKEKSPEHWQSAIHALNNYPVMLQVIFYQSGPAGEPFRQKALAAGLEKPKKMMDFAEAQ